MSDFDDKFNAFSNEVMEVARRHFPNKEVDFALIGLGDHNEDGAAIKWRRTFCQHVWMDVLISLGEQAVEQAEEEKLNDILSALFWPSGDDVKGHC